MSERRHDGPPPGWPAELAWPTEPGEDGDTLTPEDEAALDAAVAEIPDEVKRANREWVRSWAEPLGEWVPEEEGEGEKKP